MAEKSNKLSFTELILEITKMLKDNINYTKVTIQGDKTSIVIEKDNIKEKKIMIIQINFVDLLLEVEYSVEGSIEHSIDNREIVIEHIKEYTTQLDLTELIGSLSGEDLIIYKIRTGLDV